MPTEIYQILYFYRTRTKNFALPHGPLASYVKLRVVHALGMPGTSPPTCCVLMIGWYRVTAERQAVRHQIPQPVARLELCNSLS